MGQSPPDLERPISKRELCELLGVDPTTISHRVQRGVFPAPLPGYRKFWSREVVRKFLAGEWVPGSSDR
jgi:hypothetical protein